MGPRVKPQDDDGGGHAKTPRANFFSPAVWGSSGSGFETGVRGAGGWPVVVEEVALAQSPAPRR